MIPAELTRQRRYSRRSRQGCLNCKRRHTRCDEARPACNNCSRTDLACQYPTPTLPIDEQRWLQLKSPGVAVLRASSMAQADPFDSFAAKMPFNSQALLDYFCKAKSTLNPSPRLSPVNIKFPLETSLSSLTHDRSLVFATADRVGLQTMLVMAAIHHRWQHANSPVFQQCFFFHMSELVVLVNRWITQNAMRLPEHIMGLIAMLSVTESCLGNCAIAEAHLSGLLKILELKEANNSQHRSERGVSDDYENEVLERLILVAYTFLCAVRSRLGMVPDPDADYWNIWNNSFASLPQNLAALRLLTYYMSMDLQPKFNDVDACGVIYAMRGLTEAACQISTVGQAHHVQSDDLASKRIVCDSRDPQTCKGCLSYSNLLYSITDAHVSTSVTNTYKATSALEFPASWRSLAAVSIFYFNSVLWLWNSGSPMDPRLFSRFLKAVQSDIHTMEVEAPGDTTRSKFWFWKVFVGAHSVAALSAAKDIVRYRKLFDVEATNAWFGRRIRRWSIARNLSNWEDVRTVLADIVWPSGEAGLQYERLAPTVWTKAMDVDCE